MTNENKNQGQTNSEQSQLQSQAQPYGGTIQGTPMYRQVSPQGQHTHTYPPYPGTMAQYQQGGAPTPTQAYPGYGGPTTTSPGMPLPPGAMPTQGGMPVSPGGTIPLPAVQQSYIENILRLNLEKVATVYMTFEHEGGAESKAFRGEIEAAGRDHVIINDNKTGTRYLLPLIYLDYVTFQGPINYSYPYA